MKLIHFRAFFSYQTTPDVARIRNCHELACNGYGSNRTDVWEKYRDFEIKHGTIQNASKIGERAGKTLRADLKVDFYYNN